jgi:hypothetical protein
LNNCSPGAPPVWHGERDDPLRPGSLHPLHLPREVVGGGGQDRIVRAAARLEGEEVVSRPLM